MCNSFAVQVAIRCVVVKRLVLCEDISKSACGDVLFQGVIPAPSKPMLLAYYKVPDITMSIQNTTNLLTRCMHA